MPTEKTSFAGSMAEFLRDLDALAHAFPLSIRSIETATRSHAETFFKVIAGSTENQEFEQFIRALSNSSETKFENIKEDGKSKNSGSISFEFNLVKNPNIVMDALEDFKKSHSAGDLVSRSFVTAMVSQFDVFIGNLVRSIYEKRPDVLQLRSKSISYAQIIECGDVRVLEQQLIDGEVEGLLRQSHIDHFEWLEKKLDIPLRKNLEIWPRFVELTERRNILVHADGRVSKQYVTVCSRNGWVHADLPKIGEVLKVDETYFQNANDCLYEMAVKLGQVLWRKVCADEHSEADGHLISISFSLLKRKRYNLVRRIIDAFLNHVPAPHRNEAVKKVLLVNMAQAHKWSGDQGRCLELISTMDWSDTSEKFRVAEALLRDDHDAGLRHIKAALHSGDLKVDDLVEWPIFQGFRQTPHYNKLAKENDALRRALASDKPARKTVVGKRRPKPRAEGGSSDNSLN